MIFDFVNGIGGIFKSKNISQITEVCNVFNALKGNLSVVASTYKVTNENFLNYLGTVENSKATLEGYKEYLIANNIAMKELSITTKTTTALMATLKTIGATLVISTIITGISVAYDHFAHKAERASEKLKELQNEIDETNNTLRDHKKYVSDISKEYDKLSKGVNLETLENISLSDDDYQKFIDINNTLADMYPQLIADINDQGDAILTLGQKGAVAAEQLQELIDKETRAASLDIQNKLPEYTKTLKENHKENRTKYDDEETLYNEYKDKFLKGIEISDSGYQLLQDKKFEISFKNGTAEELYSEAIDKAISKAMAQQDNKQDKSKIYNIVSKQYTPDLTKMSVNVNSLSKEQLELFEKEFRNAIDGLIKEYKDKTIIQQGEMDKLNVASNDMWSTYKNNIISVAKMMPSYIEGIEDRYKPLLDKMLMSVDNDIINNIPEEEAYKYFQENFISKFNNISEQDKIDLLSLFNNEIPYNQIKSTVTRLEAQLKLLKIPMNLDFVYDNNSLYTRISNMIDNITHLSEKETAYNKLKQERLENYPNSNYISKEENDALQEYNIALNEAKKLKNDISNLKTKEEYNGWLEIANSVENYNELVKQTTQDVEQLAETTDFFTEDVKKEYDDYISKINTLQSYLEKTKTLDGLSEEDKSKLNIDFGIGNQNSMQDYANAITSIMLVASKTSPIIRLLKDEIDKCGDSAQSSQYSSLLSNLQSMAKNASITSNKIKSVSTALSDLSKKAKVLYDFNEDMNNGRITASVLNDVVNEFPMLQEKVAEFNAGIIDSKTLFEELQNAYAIDEANYKYLIEQKITAEFEYTSEISNKIQDWLDGNTDAYKTDLSNYKKLIQRKLELEAKLATVRASIANLGLVTSVDSTYEMLYADPEKENSSESLNYKKLAYAESVKLRQKNLEEEKKILEEIKNIQNEIDNYSYDTGWKTLGKDQKKGNDTHDQTVEFDKWLDWSEHSLKKTEQNTSEKERDFSNAKSVEDKQAAYTELNTAYDNQISDYTKAKTSYTTHKQDQYNELLKLVTPKEAQQYLKQIENGDVYDKQHFVEKNIYTLKSNEQLTEEQKKTNTERIYDILTAIIEDDDKIVSLEDKINDTEDKKDNSAKELNQYIIDDINNELELLDIQLADETLSAKQRKPLLKRRKTLEKELNDALKSQVDIEYSNEEDRKNEKDKIDEKQKQQDKKDRDEQYDKELEDNKHYIDNYDAMLDSKDLTYKQKEEKIEEQRKYTQKEFRTTLYKDLNQIGEDVWHSYIDQIATKEEKDALANKKTTYEKIANNHKGELATHFTGSQYATDYYSYQNYWKNKDDEDYDRRNERRNKRIGLRSDLIDELQGDISLQGGRGTIEQYDKMLGYNAEILSFHEESLKDAKDMLKAQTKGTEQWYKYKNEVANAQKEINNCKLQQKELNKEILSMPLNHIEDCLRDISIGLDKENYILNEEQEKVQAAISFYDKEIKLQEKNKKVLTDKINILQHEQEVKQRMLNISKAEWELQKAKNQKTQKVFKEGVGFVYEADEDSIRNAQEQYDNAIYEKQIGALNDQVYHIDEIIGVLQTSQQVYKDIMEDIQLDTDMQKVIEKYGIEYFTNFLNNINGARDQVTQKLKETTAEITKLAEDQEHYEYVQNIIQNVITEYDLEEVSVDEATDEILKILKEKEPKLYEIYSKERESLKKNVEEKQKEVKEQEKANDNKVEDVKKTNQEILDEYDVFKENLSKNLSEINEMISSFASGVEIKSNLVVSSISKMMSAISSIPGVNMIISNGDNGSNATVEGAGIRHSGISTGYVGDVAKNKKEFKAICLDELKPYEELNVLKAGECVLTPEQQQNILDNYHRKTIIQPKNIGSSLSKNNTSLSFTGDIVLNNVQDTNTLANDIVKNLPQAMIRSLYKH